MNLAILLAALEAAPGIISDVEACVAEIKANPATAAKVQGAVAGLEKLASDLAPIISKL